MMRNLENALRSGLADLGLPVNDNQVASLLDYLALLQKWNKVYNLTALRSPQEMLTHHLLDSLAVIAPLQRQVAALRDGRPRGQVGAFQDEAIRVLDVGAGAGLPGVVIAIMCPDISVDCLDAVAKKAGFIQQVALTLPLMNLRSLHARVESLSGTYHIISSRAFASLPDFVDLSAANLTPNGIWMAMKGKLPVPEIASLPATVTVFHVEQLQVPGLAAERCLVWMSKT